MFIIYNFTASPQQKSHSMLVHPAHESQTRRQRVRCACCVYITHNYLAEGVEFEDVVWYVLYCQIYVRGVTQE